MDRSGADKLGENGLPRLDQLLLIAGASKYTCIQFGGEMHQIPEGWEKHRPQLVALAVSRRKTQTTDRSPVIS
jgi:hypothetical protein